MKHKKFKTTVSEETVDFMYRTGYRLLGQSRSHFMAMMGDGICSKETQLKIE